MSKKILLVMVSALLLAPCGPAFAKKSKDPAKQKSSHHFRHIPIISAPIGFVRGAHMGTKAFAGALGDENGALESTLGFVLGAPLGAVAGTVSSIFGGPFSE